MRLIESEKDLREGTAHLASICPVMARLVKEVKLPPLRRSKGGFEGLANIILSQQLSVAAADTIEKRLTERVKGLTAENILKARPATMRACGVSRPKIKHLKNLARAVKDGTLDFDALETAAPEAAREMLTSISGIGPWTSDIYVMFCIGHADGFAPGDLALQEAARLAYNWRKRPDIRRLEKHAARWSPWRGVAARLLWANYRQLRETRAKLKKRA